MEIIIKENYDKLSEEAALFVKKRIIEKPDLVLGIASGSTAVGLYQELIKMHKEQGLDFSKITIFNLDEYLTLAPSHPFSYNSYLRKNFVSHINVLEENIFLMNGSAENPEAYCKWYEEKIKEKNDIDLQILGLGRNGHIAFNEPGSDFDSITRVVELDETTINDNARFFENKIENVPKIAITMGIKTIFQARECLLLANGKHKQEIVKKTLKGPITRDVSASILQKHPNIIVMLDKEAAGNLPQ